MDVFGSGKGRIDNTDESVQEIMQAMSAYYPALAEMTRKQYDPQARAEVDIAKKYSPELGQLNTDLLRTEGKDVSQLGRELSREEQLGAAQTEADILKGPGKEVFDQSLALQKAADPEYFKNRELLMGDLNKAFQYLGDPNQLSKGESEGIARALGRTNSPVSSPMQTISNAMTFGEKQASRRGEFNNLVNMRTNATPALKSGMDAGSIAGRRTVLPNFGQNNYVGIQTPGVQNANALGQSFINNTFATDQNRQNAYVAKNAGAGIGSGTGKIVGSIVAGAAACWVAREVYGTQDPKWMIFREWMLHEAPSWFRKLYLTFGERFARFIHDKPQWKNVIRTFMDSIVNPRS